VLAAALSSGGAQAFDEARYPDWAGQWIRIGEAARWDPGKPVGLGQEAPLTAEYQAKFERSLADQHAGGQGLNLMSRCYPPGMPRMMLAYNQFEFLVFPDVTYVVQEHFGELRRIHTGAQAWPQAVTPTFSGYSVGRWADADSSGRYRALAIETRMIGGPRTFDSSGTPLHEDGRTIVKELIHLDRDDADILRNEITTIDHALTRPWTVTRSYRRNHNPGWFEHPCESAYNQHLFIGGEAYFFSADGRLMPGRKGQPAPDLRYFEEGR
jgi:hypothetical protein